ncbi:LOW QUALITY PROTEIN: hypothetical protein RSAG8_09281, partial [Rhizoctonia solani AG-8 WAC10335]
MWRPVRLTTPDHNILPTHKLPPPLLLPLIRFPPRPRVLRPHDPLPNHRDTDVNVVYDTNAPSSLHASSAPGTNLMSCTIQTHRLPFTPPCTWHELAALGTHGRRAVWIEGDGPPPDEGHLELEPYDESASLRLMLTTVGSNNPKEVAVPPTVRAQLAHVSCVAFEDSTGTIALATLDGRHIAYLNPFFREHPFSHLWYRCTFIISIGLPFLPHCTCHSSFSCL